MADYTKEVALVLKHTFHKLLRVTNDGMYAYILMMGRCSTDNICAIPESFERQAKSMGVYVADECTVFIFYLGPDRLPLERVVMLPDGKTAVIVPVAEGQNVANIVAVANTYLHVMEELQFALQMGMSRKKAAYHYWQLYCLKCCMWGLSRFVDTYEKFEEDVFVLRAALKEQELLPAKRKRGWKPNDLLNHYGRPDLY